MVAAVTCLCCGNRWCPHAIAHIVFSTLLFAIVPPPSLNVRPQTCASKGVNAPAWQIDQGNNNACFALGADLTNNRPAPVSYQPADWRNPARGVAMTYSGGESTYCPNGNRRSFTLNMWCAPFPFPYPGPPPPPGQNSSWNGMYWIDEFNTCGYVANRCVRRVMLLRWYTTSEFSGVISY